MESPILLWKHVINESGNKVTNSEIETKEIKESFHSTPLSNWIVEACRFF